MNKDIIYREDAIKAVEDVSENYTKEGDREWHPHIDFITQALVQVPFVPPKRGEWIDKGWKGDWQFETDGRGNCWHEYECSECGFHNKGGKSNYCPNCGAKMKGADDE